MACSKKGRFPGQRIFPGLGHFLAVPLSAQIVADVLGDLAKRQNVPRGTLLDSLLQIFKDGTNSA